MAMMTAGRQMGEMASMASTASLPAVLKRGPNQAALRYQQSALYLQYLFRSRAVAWFRIVIPLLPNPC